MSASILLQATSVSLFIRKSSFKITVICSLLLVLPVFESFGQKSQNIPNPVLPGVADAGVIRYNGEYYLGGVFTNGSFYKSRDLVQWEGPVHVFSMNNEWTAGPSAHDIQIHANDINYINGIFHQYWSVNYWGKDQHVVHIGHATASKVLGPYREPVKESWLDNRIDPHLFVGDDRQLYLYMVKFTDGNTIWVRPMQDPWTFSGEPVYVFASLPNTWETRDNRVAEGPWVIKYRNRYYLMYNTNHTSPRWGNYTLGVAEADAPLNFHHGSKYPHPVVQSNQVVLEDNFEDLLKYKGTESDTFRYTIKHPDPGWNKINFDASSWQKGKAGFGSEMIENSTSRRVRTAWKTPHIWLRKDFVIDKENTGQLMLRIHHDGATQVFLNGQSIYEHTNGEYTTWHFNEKATALLRDGKNVMAVYSVAGEQSHFLDLSLFDMKDSQGDDILYSPGQPNILRGPNGFEWWLIYMANKNREKRGQYINRVHFFSKKLIVDAITSSNTPDAHPVPALPTFGDWFDATDAQEWQSKWDIRSGNWHPKNNELLQTGHGVAQAYVKAMPATHYLFEASVKAGDAAKAGVYAWWKDDNHWLRVILDAQEKKWAYTVKAGGTPETFSFPLPADFNYHAYHTLRVYKNAAQFTITIDDLPAPQKPMIDTAGFSDKGIPGLYSEGASSSFDGVLYTIGWDEFDTHISGWESTLPDSTWVVSEKGISQTKALGEHTVFKGDMLEEYEISLQITMENSKGSAGIYPVYADAQNYLKAVFDAEKQQFIVSGKRQGKPLDVKAVSLDKYQSYYADMKYTDFIEKHYSFDTPTWIDGLRLSKTPHLQPDTLIKDIHKKMEIFYRQEGRWHPLTDHRQVDSAHPGFDEIAFAPIKVEGLKFVNKQADDHQFYIYKIGVKELLKHSYNLRVAKFKDRTIFWVDGKEVLLIKNDFPASRAGLLTLDNKARFNGITLFHLGK